jgi:hypothetical protein
MSYTSEIRINLWSYDEIFYYTLKIDWSYESSRCDFACSNAKRII